LLLSAFAHSEPSTVQGHSVMHWCEAPSQRACNRCCCSHAAIEHLPCRVQPHFKDVVAERAAVALWAVAALRVQTVSNARHGACHGNARHYASGCCIACLDCAEMSKACMSGCIRDCATDGALAGLHMCRLDTLFWLTESEPRLAPDCCWPNDTCRVDDKSSQNKVSCQHSM
jgi:hypothetical protein